MAFLFVGTIGLVFVFFFGTGGGLQGSSSPTGSTIIELGDVRLTSIDLGRQRTKTEAELRARLGDAYDQVGADRFVDSQALGVLISNVVFAAAAEDLGLHVTKAELRQIVQSSPGFIDDQGRFDPEAFDYFARREYGTQRLFIQFFTRQLLQQKLIQLVIAQTDVSDAEIDLITRYESEEVRIAYVALDPTSLPIDVEISDTEIESYAAENESELEALFEERIESFAEPERVKARHILILASEDADDDVVDDARERATAARDRLMADEDFATLAAELSQDAGTADQGGDLGIFARGSNETPLDDAAFSLEVGELSEVIRSSYGFHILLIDEKFAAGTPDFSDQRSLLARESLVSKRAREIADQRSATLVAEIEAGVSLEDAAREAGLTLERPAALRRRADGFISGLGAAQDVMSAAFGLTAGTSSSEVYDVAGRSILIQVVERTEPSEGEIESARAERRERILAEKQNRAISIWEADFRRRLEESGRLKINAELALGS